MVGTPHVRCQGSEGRSRIGGVVTGEWGNSVGTGVQEADWTARQRQDQIQAGRQDFQDRRHDWRGRAGLWQKQFPSNFSGLSKSKQSKLSRFENHWRLSSMRLVKMASYSCTASVDPKIITRWFFIAWCESDRTSIAHYSNNSDKIIIIPLVP